MKFRNQISSKNGFSKHISPNTLITGGSSPNYADLEKLNFGEYAQVYHTNGVAGFGNNNIMWGGGPGTRNHFSVGQSFRINTDTTSMLNANGNRAGPTRTCAPNTNSTTCPVLSLDSLPH